MAAGKTQALEGRFLRVDLTTGKMGDEAVDAATMRKFVGGTGLGAKILYEEVSPGVEWADPENRLIVASGPLGGTRVMGSGTFSIVTKGPMTNGATSTQANGFLGAYLRFAGYDGVVFQGASERLVYLYVDGGKAELRDASHLAGMDTWDTQDAIAAELGKSGRDISVFSIGPAGENLVKFAAVAGDKGHVAGHNGSGAVMGSKRLKAIVATKSGGRIRVHDATSVAAIAKDIVAAVRQDPATRRRYEWGTGSHYSAAAAAGWLPTKNYLTNIFAEHEPFMAVNEWSLANMTERKIRVLLGKIGLDGHDRGIRSRNHLAQILNTDDEPVSGLYGAGECGSIFGQFYPAGGGNLAERIAFGRIAGEDAARCL